MRILFFLESLHGGGKERRAAELISYLMNRNGEYEIELVLTEEEIYYEDILNTGIRITVLRRRALKYDPGIFFRFYTVCKRFKPDLIHSWGKMATFYSIPAKIICGVPLVANLIADTIKGYGKFSRYAFLLKANVLFSDAVLANSKAGLLTYNLSSAKSKVIYNGVRLSRFRDYTDKISVKNELGITTEFIVIMVATFSVFKDYDLFVDTAKATAGSRDDVTFLGVGDGPDLDRIKSRIEKEHVSNVILTGRRKDVERLVSCADIGILCTRSEGISNSIIEYMALAKPVIASDLTGGSKELIDEGATGYCTKRDPFIIAMLIKRLLDDPDLRVSMGIRGRERIVKNFSIEKMGDEFRSLYAGVLYSQTGNKPSFTKSVI
ncbi:MAG TPA: glycosyltransferase [Bacteroidales bacterium]|nr:glycosyltransferase [Bacteroidales bacterium]